MVTYLFSRKPRKDPDPNSGDGEAEPRIDGEPQVAVEAELLDGEFPKTPSEPYEPDFSQRPSSEKTSSEAPPPKEDPNVPQKPIVLLTGRSDSWANHVLRGRRLDVAVASSMTIGAALVAQLGPAVVLIEDDLSDGSTLDALDKISEVSSTETSMMVVLPAEEWIFAESFFAAGAIEVIERGDQEALLGAIVPVAGAEKAKGERAKVEIPVATELQGQTLELATIDLRPSGIALRGLPDLRRGTRVRIGLHLFGRSEQMTGEVTRTWNKDGASCGALRFVGLSAAQRAWLRESVLKLSGNDPEVAQWKAEIRAVIGELSKDGAEGASRKSPWLRRKLSRRSPSKPYGADLESDSEAYWEAASSAPDIDGDDSPLQTIISALIVLLFATIGVAALIELTAWTLSRW